MLDAPRFYRWAGKLSKPSPLLNMLWLCLAALSFAIEYCGCYHNTLKGGKTGRGM